MKNRDGKKTKQEERLARATGERKFCEIFFFVVHSSRLKDTRGT